MAPKAAPKARGGKRATTVEAELGDATVEMEAPAAKRNKADPMVDAVTESIKNMDLPLNCRNMLAAMVPGSLATPIEDRQKLQAMAVQMIGNALNTHQTSLQKAIAAEVRRLSEIEASSKAVESKDKETEAAYAESSVAVEAKKNSLTEASQDVLQAKQSLADKEEAHDKEARLIAEAREDGKAVEATLRENFEPLKSGDWETGQSKYHIDILAPLVKRVKLDESLATALPSSLTKKPAERGPFDRTVIEQLEIGLQAKITEFTEFVNAADARAAAHVAAVDSARHAFEAAKEGQQQAAGKLATAIATQRELASTLANVKAEAEAFGPEHAKATEARSDKESTLRAFESGAIACFETIQNRTKPLATELTADSCTTGTHASKVIDEVPDVTRALQIPLGGQ